MSKKQPEQKKETFSSLGLPVMPTNGMATSLPKAEVVKGQIPPYPRSELIKQGYIKK